MNGKRTLILLCLALGLAGPTIRPATGGHGAHAPKVPKESAAKKDAHGAKKEPTATPTPKPVLGKPLGGYYDINLLRPASRTVRYRYAFKDILQTINQGYPWRVMISCSIEFGAESGLAEVGENEAAFREDICKALERFAPRDLLRTSGKRRLKEEIIAAFNRRLATVRARQVYWTDFRMWK